MGDSRRSADTDMEQRSARSTTSRQYDEAEANQVNQALYTSLDPSERQIRLLKINESDTDISSNYVVHCSLTIASLDDEELRFDALSYVWNDPSIRTEILVNGHTFLATASLAEALTTFRNRGLVSGYFWVDAICTNQCDLVERGQQIAMMGTIYRWARVVHIWLGMEDEYTERTFESMERLHSGELKASDAICEESLVKGLKQLISRPWFSRIWVVQEAIVARVPLVHCGNFMIHFKRLRSSIVDFVVAYYGIFRGRPAQRGAL